MSVENILLSAIVEDGPSVLRTMYAQGSDICQDFPIYDAEFEWIEAIDQQTQDAEPSESSVQRFPEFEWALPKETVKDLMQELKEERAFEEVNELVQSIERSLT
jgi:hypothetical protein